MTYTLPELPYKFSDLEPYIDAKTVEIHLTKHTQAYVDKLNAVLVKYPVLAGTKLEELLVKLKTLTMDEADRTALRNNAGGYLNHSLYFRSMGKVKTPELNLTGRVVKTFGSIDTLKKTMNDAAMTRFGSGWAWLVENNHQELEVYSTPNQDSPYLNGHTPLIALDVWEHAYYLKYQNRRAEYLENWWNVFTLF
jgi:Fe-Mn family superoxide dismutase